MCVSKLGDPPYFIKPDYVERSTPKSQDTARYDEFQPDVYSIAAFLGELIGAVNIIDFGCGKGYKLLKFCSSFYTIGVDLPETIDICRTVYPKKRWLSCDFSKLEDLELKVLDTLYLERTIAICADVIEHIVDPLPFLGKLHDLLSRIPFLVMSTPERDIVQGVEHSGPPPNPQHVREWNAGEFASMLTARGFKIRHIGMSRTLDVPWNPRIFQTLMVILSR